MKGLIKRFFPRGGRAPAHARAQRRERNRARGAMVVSFDGRVVRLRMPDPL